MASGDESLDFAWNVVTTYLDIKVQNVRNEQAQERFRLASIHLNNAGIIEMVEGWFLECWKHELCSTILNAFWAALIKEKAVTEDVESFDKAVEGLHLSLQACSASVEAIECLRKEFRYKHSPGSLMDQLKLQLSANLYTKAPIGFNKVVNAYYRRTIKCFLKVKAKQETSLVLPGCLDPTDNEENCDNLMCSACTMLTEKCACESILSRCQSTTLNLSEMGLLERIAVDEIISITHEQMDDYVQGTCKDNYEVHYLKTLEQWLDKMILSWMKFVYCIKEEEELSKKQFLKSLKERMYQYMYEIYAQVRLRQIFYIVVDFPDSQPALEDLKVCMERTNIRSSLIKTLKNELETRLLHPGVTSHVILSGYISTVKSLQLLDPTGVILELIGEPVRKYLRNRDDTVRCIIHSMLDGKGSELSDELHKGDPLLLDQSTHSDEEDDESWKNWEPEPFDADPTKTSKSRRCSDIISILVNIYGSLDLFIQEYSGLLADRILGKFTYEVTWELRNLEHLKVKFGENRLHFCDVMIKDVEDSRRLNTNIQTDSNVYSSEPFGVNALILSAQFWPPFKEERLLIPDYVQKALDNYTRGYETLKGNRTLNWKTHLGQVHLEVELKNGRTFNVLVPPTHATILLHFEKQDTWTLEDLSHALKVSPSLLRRKLAYWQGQGVIVEEGTDVYVLKEDDPLPANGNQSMSDTPTCIEEDEEQESVTASAKDQREEELQTFWSYIVGMLTNLESLPLERIHNMLKMFIIQGPTALECSQQELRQFLDRQVRDHKLLYSGGLYRLPKN